MKSGGSVIRVLRQLFRRRDADWVYYGDGVKVARRLTVAERAAAARALSHMSDGAS